MPNIALITGASRGIGLELAHCHAATGGDLVITARNKSDLLTLKLELESKYGVTAHVIVQDLAEPNAAKRLFDQTEKAGLKIDILINNAGFGCYGRFVDSNIQRNLEMMQVNMMALAELTHLYLQPMLARSFGRILQVASSAAFVPGPMQAVYYASKSFVVSFSQAINKELETHNISSTALCPGPVLTDFMRVANVDGVALWQRSATAKSVARCGYKAMLKKRLIVVNDKRLGFLIRFVLPLVPRKFALHLSKRTMTKSQL